MSLRRVIATLDRGDVNVRAFCAEHGISTWSFYALQRRYAVEGERALVARSRAPIHVANRTPDWLEDRIVEARKRLVDLGWDAGSVSIHDSLIDEGVEGVPSPSTIWRVLRRRGFVVPAPTKAPKRSTRRFSAARANECWQFDDTTWPLAHGTEVKIINVLDDCTRVLVASRAVTACTADAVFDTLMRGANEWGLPERTLCDNAKAHHALHDALAALGINTRHSRPYHPQTCGKVERFHQTLKRCLTAQDATTTLDELQTLLDEFRDHYNHRRRHRTLGRKIPADVWAATPKSGPANRPLDMTTTVYTLTIAPHGIADTGRYAIGIGKAHAGQRATVVITGVHCHVFIDNHLERALTLDPTRRSQPHRTPTVRP